MVEKVIVLDTQMQEVVVVAVPALSVQIHLEQQVEQVELE
tara:strand:- start:298 stop:417 length:120 start_codon:yes stop_codon:yes gene_type:complete